MNDSMPPPGGGARGDATPGTDPEDGTAGPGDGAPAAPAEPAAPAPLGVPRAPTGSAEVDALLERLADADGLPADGHPQVYEDVHRGLRETLAALDARPGPPAPAPHTSPYDHRS
jgi:hypothetical protein